MTILCKILLILLASVFNTCQSTVISKVDQQVLQKFWRYAQANHLNPKEPGERITLIARFFLDTPYKSNTLDSSNKEQLVINLHELDCVTFVDNVLALAFLSEYTPKSERKFKQNLQQIRYRQGIIEDFTSRLHYSSDWLYDMQQKQLLENITTDLGGIRYIKEINFMSEHQEQYPALKSNPQLLTKIKNIEGSINKRTHYYIPKTDIDKIYSKIKSGDIILITTNISGIDTSHLGIAISLNGTIYLAHASSDGKRVMISSSPLKEYMANIRTQTGVIIGRAHHNMAQDLFEQK